MGLVLRSFFLTAALSRGAGGVLLALRRARRRAALAAVGLFLALGGAGFLSAAGFMELAAVLGAIRASLIVGAALAVAGGGFILSARGRTAAESTRHRPVEPSMATALVDAGRELSAAASRNPGSFALAAFLIGLLVSGSRPRR